MSGIHPNDHHDDQNNSANKDETIEVVVVEKPGIFTRLRDAMKRNPVTSAAVSTVAGGAAVATGYYAYQNRDRVQTLPNGDVVLEAAAAVSTLAGHLFG